MDELIPLTDFDKRSFPDLTEQEKINFIMHSNDFERISMKFEDIEVQLLSPNKTKPAVSGQMRSIHKIIDLAKEPDIFPRAKDITPYNFDSLFPWFAKLHKELMYDFSKQGEKMLNEVDYPAMSELATYRQDDKKLGERLMPPPHKIKELLAQAFTDFCSTYDLYRDSFSNPRLIETHDWKTIEAAAHKLGLAICCIKPFNDGSNRIGRIVENLARLNTGLKFKIHTDKQAYLKEIWQLQDSEYKFN